MVGAIQVEAVYFTAREGGNAFAIKDQKVENPEPCARFGARAKGVIDLPHDCFAIWVGGLLYHARITEELSGSVVLPSFGHPTRGQRELGVRDRWRLHMGFIDLDLARDIAVSPYLTFTPFSGLRFAGVRHKARFTYQPSCEELSIKNKLWALGPHMGFEALWQMVSWLGLYSRLGTSLLYGETYVHQDQGQLKFFDKFWDTRKMVEGSLGLDFCVSRCPTFFARIAWDTYLFFHQNRLYNFVDESAFVTRKGDLAIFGLSFGLGVVF